MAQSRQVMGLLLPVSLLVAWVVGSSLDLFSSLIPSPYAVFDIFRKWMGFKTDSIKHYYDNTWLRDLAGSMMRALVGFFIGAFAAIVLGLIVGWSRPFRWLVDPTVHLFRAVPRTALLPFVIIILGLGNAPALALVAVGAFFQIYIQVVMGVQLVPRDLKRAAYMLGCSERQVLWRVVIPHALPSIFAGLRLGIVYAWTMLVLAEMFAVGSGFGYTLWRAFEYLQIDLLIACVLMICICGWLSDRAVLLLMTRKIRWAAATAETEI